MPRDLYITRISTATASGFGAPLNLLLLLAILWDPLKILRKGSWITILNLAVADLMSCISMSLISTREILNMKPNMLASSYFVWGLSISASFMLLAFFTLQVFTVTKFPFKGPQIWTRTRVVMSCVVIWLLAVPLAYTYITYHTGANFNEMLKGLIAQIFVLEIIVIIQIVLKIFIFLEIHKSRRDSGQSQSSKHREIAKTVMILVVIQLLTAVPYVVTRQVELFARLGMLSYHLLLVKFTYYYQPIAMLNFCANPVIYFLRLPDYKRTLLSLCGSGRRRIHRSSTQSFTMKSDRASFKRESTSTIQTSTN